MACIAAFAAAIPQALGGRNHDWRHSLARTNFKYEKRQKELAKQKKAEEKRLRRLEKRNPTDGEDVVESLDGDEAVESGIEQEASEQATDDAV